MIQLMTKVNIIDNSGGSIGRCLKVLEPHGRKFAKVGDVILVSIKETVKLSSLYKNQPGNRKGGDSNRLTRGSLYKAIVVRTKNPNYPFRGNLGTFEDNAVILLKSNLANNKKNQGSNLTPLGTRIKGPISNILTLRNQGYDKGKYQKILSLSKLHY